MFLFLCKLGSRRQIDFLFNSPEFVGNLAACSGQELSRTPAGDTLAYLCERLSPDALSEVRVAMVRDLIRSRALEDSASAGGGGRSPWTAPGSSPTPGLTAPTAWR